MKTKLLLAILFYSICTLVFSQCPDPVPAGFTCVPDDQFEAYLEANAMGNGDPNDNLVPTASINTIENLNVSSQGIQSLEGVEDFVALKTLNCSSNSSFLATLNLFSNTALTDIRCFNNGISSLTLPNSNTLSYLNCGNNKLSSLDVSAYTLLENLLCYNNYFDLGPLDLKANTALIEINCHDSGVSSLDISQCALLEKLYCYNADIPTSALNSLDISSNLALKEVICYENNISTLTLSNNNYNSLFYFDCSYNPIGSLDTSMFPNIESLYCASNGLSNLDVSGNSKLIDFGCWNNNLSSLNVSICSNLEYLECGDNPNLSNLVLPNNKVTLNSLWAYNMKLSSLNYDEYLQLQYLDIGINEFSSADVSMLQNLIQFYCNENQLKSLNIANGNIDTLEWMWAHNNPVGLCIQVDDLAKATSKSSPNWKRDPGSSFSLNCALNNQEYKKENITIYPNPTIDLLYINLNLEANFIVTNTLGNVIRKGTLIAGENEVNLTNLTDGMYFLNINSTQGSVTKKVLKK